MEGIEGLAIKIIGADPQSVTVNGDSVGTFRLLLKTSPENLKHKRTDITISAVNITTGEESHHGAIFNGPKHGGDEHGDD